MTKDFMLGADKDLSIENGDFVLDDSDAQHIKSILEANQGDYRQSPLIGYFIENDLKSNARQTEIIEARIRLALVADGYIVNKIEITNGDISIDATR